MSQKRMQTLGGYILAYMVISAGIVGYFVGLQSPMKQAAQATTRSVPTAIEGEQGVMRATSYADIGDALRSLRPPNRPAIASQSQVQLLEDRKITPAEKTFALNVRQRNRAFNGAPPTIPHPVETMSSKSCMACHGDGMKTDSLRAGKMPHAFYTNCTQCHVEQNPTRTQPAIFVQNSFAGLPAPTEGPRAFEGAPPQLPHTTWMRNDCQSCHGPTGNLGIQTTHPWRQNCLQCHAPSAESEQIPFPTEPAFLSPPSLVH